MVHRRRRALLTAVTGLAAGNVIAVGANGAHAQAETPQTSATSQAGTTGVLYFRQQHGNPPATPVPPVASVTEDGTVGTAPSFLEGLEQTVAFSPDGSKVAYFTPTSITVSDATFANAKIVAFSGNGTLLEDPRWLAGGTKLAYLAYDSTTRRSSIWTVAPDGTDAALVPIPGAYATANIDEFDVTPNGDFIFRTGRGLGTGGDGTELDFYRPGTSAVTPLLTGSIGKLAADPDGIHATVEIDDTATPANGGTLENVDIATKTATMLATKVSPHRAVLWSPDGNKLAFSHLDALATSFPGGAATNTDHLVLLDKVSGASHDVVTPDATLPNNTSEAIGWQILPASASPPVRTQVFRDAGGDRVDTGIAISRQRWAAAASAKAVVLATSLNYPDALSGGPLAAKKGGPLLLTDGSATQADPRVLAEIRRVLPHGGHVYVLGGDKAVNPAIVAQLKSLGYAITQFKGGDRADTALRVARDGLASPQHVVLATGAGFADALAAGPYAAGPFADAPGAPAAIVLSDGTTLDAATAAFLHGKTVATVGAQAGHAWPTAAKAFPGVDRFDTAARVAAEFTGAFASTQVGIANGIGSATNPGYPDALTGGAFMAESNGPIVLVDGIAGAVPPPTQAVLAARVGNTRADIFGGKAIISPALAAQIVSLLHGTAQF